MKHKKSKLLLGVAGAWAVGWGVVAPAFHAEAATTRAPFNVETDVNWTNKFWRKPAPGSALLPWGWVGGDGAYSVELPGGRQLWTFGDSALGQLDASGTRLGTALATPRNSMVVTKRDGRESTFDTHHGGFRDKIDPGGPDRYYWPAATAVVDVTNPATGVNRKEVRVFARHFLQTPDNDFYWGTKIARFDATTLEPIGDLAATVMLPQTKLGLQWGSEVVFNDDDKWWYIYGEDHTGDTDEDGITGKGSTGELVDKDDGLHRSTYVARARQLEPDNPNVSDDWEFLTTNGWAGTASQSTLKKLLLNDGKTSMKHGVYTVKKFDQPNGTAKFVFLTLPQTDPGGRLEAYVSDKPEEGLKGPIPVYTAPEYTRDEVLTYIPQIHDIVDGKGRHLVSYSVNRVKNANGDEYRPRFLRVDLRAIAATQ